MKSISSKLWLSITSLVLIIVLVIWLFQITLLEKFYIDERTDTLLNQGNKIVAMIETSRDYKILSKDALDTLTSLSTSYDVQIIILDDNNEFLFSSRPDKRSNKQLDLPPFLSAVRSETTTGETFIKKNMRFGTSISSIVVGIPLKNNNNLEGYVIITSPLASIKDATYILKKQLTLITLVSLIVGTFLSLVLAKQFTAPILQITNTSKKIANGDFTANVAVNSKDEIGLLGNTINNMAFQLGQIEKFRREFIANTSHELKTPISLIRAYAELIMDIEDADKVERDEHLQVIVDESKRLNTMVGDILYLSEMEAGYYNPDLTKFNVIETIRNVISKLSVLSFEKNIHIDIKHDTENTLINADKDKMYQVLFNLINNAINYSHENSNVTIKTTTINDKVRIKITDNGKGIPKEDLPYVWDRFYKVDKSRKRNSSSTGLGMCIVKNILEAHNFNYGIESELNKGTSVWIEMEKEPD